MSPSVSPATCPIYRLATAIDRGGLWDNEHVPDLAQVTLITEQALRDGAPGYQHEIRVLDADGRTHWVSEEVGISRLAEDEWSLIGVASEVTARHEAEEAREASEAQLQQILARADCMLWRANVARDGARTDYQIFLRRAALAKPQPPIYWLKKEWVLSLR